MGLLQSPLQNIPGFLGITKSLWKGTALELNKPSRVPGRSVFTL